MANSVCIIGGGPAGMMAAIAAASAGAKVTLVEKGASPGRKLLATGNGHCNFTNRDLDLEHFHGDTGFITAAIAQFDGPHTLDFFRALGIPPWPDERGRCFPASREAAAVLFSLTKEMEHLGVKVVVHSEIVGAIRRRNGGFALQERGKAFEADAVIVATGGKASPQLGSRVSLGLAGRDPRAQGGGYEIARQFGHTVTPLRAALVPIELVGPWFHKLQGVRMDASLTISLGNTTLWARRARPSRLTDEVLFASYGISGPLALRASRMIGEGGCELEMNFLPGREIDAALALVKARAASLRNRTAGDFLTGLLPAKVGWMIVGQTGIAQETPSGEITPQQLSHLARNLTHWPIRVKGLRPFKEAQVTVGGVATSEIDPATMESKLVPGLFFCGEVMDVDGDSGGYNLQWAWTSGFIAGRSAGPRFP